MNCVKYNIQGQAFRGSKQIAVPPKCNGWTAINKGADLVIVNGIPLKPYPPGHPELSGESLAVGGNIGEEYSGYIQADFAAAASDPLLVIVFKFYL